MNIFYHTMKTTIIDGIRYELNKEDKTATVIPLDSGAYSGDVVIPCTIFEKKFFGKDKVYHVVYIGNYAFKNANLLSITMPCTIRNIADNAFVGCDSLKCIRLTATSVEEFCNHNKCNYKLSEILDDIERRIVINGVEINDIAIPKGITNIKKGTFYSCTLYSISIPNTVKEIEEEAFYNCASLTSINIPDSVLKIGSYAFSECSSLVSIRIPKCIRTIEEGLFDGCNSLESVIIPNSVSKIGESAFFDCSMLKSIVIPNNISKIGEFAFSNCSSLSEVNIPNGVETIDDWAFSECHSLTKVVIPHSIKSMGKNVFSSCYALTTIHWDTNYTFDSDEYNVFLEIAPQITSMVFGDNIENISSSICKGMNNLSEIILGKNIKDIELDAFIDTELSKNDIVYIDKCLIRAKVSGDYVISEGTRMIANGAFRECKELYKVTIPDSVTSIGDEAFMGCSSLTFVTIPDSVTSIGGSAFRYCSSLTSVTIPNSVTSIGEHAFQGCSSLTSITIPDSVTSIGDSAFRYCSSLISITIPKSVTNIGQTSFAGCKFASGNLINNSSCVSDRNFGAIIYDEEFDGLLINNHEVQDCRPYVRKSISVKIPHSITSIRRNLFVGFPNLISIVWDAISCKECVWEEEREPSYLSVGMPVSRYSKNVKTMDHFYGPFAKIASQITSFEFGPNVRDIPNHLFWGMRNLYKITIPSNVRTIAGGFSHFKEISIPAHIHSKYYEHTSKIYNNDLEAIFYDADKINIIADNITQILK